MLLVPLHAPKKYDVRVNRSGSKLFDGTLTIILDKILPQKKIFMKNEFDEIVT